MEEVTERKRPGDVLNAIMSVLAVEAGRPMAPAEIETAVSSLIGTTPASSVRSSLRLHTNDIFVQEGRGLYRLSDERQLTFVPIEGPVVNNAATDAEKFESTEIGRATLYRADCLEWLDHQPDASIHAVVTDPPYGLHEYTDEQQSKLRAGKGGVWRVPPSFDGHVRSPLPRFTTLTTAQLAELDKFFYDWGKALMRVLVPGANVIVASNPLLSYLAASSLARAGLERRGEIIRLVMTMRGGDRPKHAHEEFSEVSVMPRSMWEPWLMFRRPIEGRVQDNLRTWKTGGFRRPSADRPFGDVIKSAPTRKRERDIAPHPSLKPQAFMREVVRAVLPLGEGVVLDPFAGSGSTLAAAEAVGYQSIGVERDSRYFELASGSIPKLAKLEVLADPDYL